MGNGWVRGHLAEGLRIPDARRDNGLALLEARLRREVHHTANLVLSVLNIVREFAQLKRRHGREAGPCKHYDVEQFSS